MYKKCSTDGDLTIFLPKRELKMNGETGQIGNLEGIVIISENLAKKDNVKVFVQVRTQVETFESVTLALASYPIRTITRIYRSSITVLITLLLVPAFLVYPVCS